MPTFYLYGLLEFCPAHGGFNGIWIRFQRWAESLQASRRDQIVVLDADADTLRRNIDARLDGDDAAGGDGRQGIADIMYIQTKIVAQAMGHEDIHGLFRAVGIFGA